MALATKLKAAAAAAGAVARTTVPVLIRNLAIVGGAALIGYGAWLVYAPAGYIVAGVLLAGAAILTATVSK